MTKEQLLKDHDKELKTLQQELNKARATRNQAENSLAEELKKEKQALQGQRLCHQRAGTKLDSEDPYFERSVKREA